MSLAQASPLLAGPVHAVRRAAAAWDQFWFRPADPTVLGLSRIFCGLMVLAIHLAYSYDLQEFFGADAWYNLELATEFRQEAPWVAPPADWSGETAPRPLPESAEERARTLQYMQRWGLDPRVTSAQGNRVWSLWFHVTDPTGMHLVHAGVLAVMLLFTLGLWTRITSVLTWLAALCYIQRSPMTLFGMDTMMTICLLYLMIGPSGAAFSLDRWLAGRPARRRGETLADPEPCVSANLALRLMQVHFCFIYMAAGLSKLLGSSWWNGTALWWTVANYEFAPLSYPWYLAGLRWLCEHRWLWESAMTAGVVYTLALEISFPFLVWIGRLRGVMVSGAVLLHTGIAFTMGLVGFGLLMLALVLAFIPAAAVRELFCRTRQQPAPEHAVPGPVLPPPLSGAA